MIACAHYWAGTNANDTLREYIAFELSAVPKDVEDVMKAIGLLELTWTTERSAGNADHGDLANGRSLVLPFRVQGPSCSHCSHSHCCSTY